MGYVEQLFTILSNEETDNISREHCTAALLSLASSYPPALAECMRPELHMKHLLTTRLKEIKAKQELQVSSSSIKEGLFPSHCTAGVVPFSPTLVQLSSD